MSVKGNKAAFVRWMEACEKLDLSLLDRLVVELYAPDYIFHDPSFANRRGRADLKQWLHDNFGGIVGLKFQIDEMVEEGDCVATRGLMTTTSKSSGETVTQDTMIFSHFKDGLIAEEWQIVRPHSG